MEFNNENEQIEHEIFNMINDDNHEELRKLLITLPPNEIYQQHGNILNIAASMGYEDLVSSFIQKGSNLNLKCEDEMYTYFLSPIVSAIVISINPPIVRMLVDAGADKDVVFYGIPIISKVQGMKIELPEFTERLDEILQILSINPNEPM